MKSGNIRLAFLGIGNQSSVDKDMPLRVIGYDGAVYRGQIKQDKAGKKPMRYPAVTLVLYFDYKKRWDKPLRLKECLDIPEKLKKYVNDYKVHLFQIAWLSPQTVKKFTSDFRYVADYFVQMRKNNNYQIPKEKFRHVEEVLDMLIAVTKDYRLEDIYQSLTEGDDGNMEAWIDKIEDRGRKEGGWSMLVSNVQNLMKNLKCSADKAMDVLDVPQNERAALMAAL